MSAIDVGDLSDLGEAASEDLGGDLTAGSGGYSFGDAAKQFAPQLLGSGTSILGALITTPKTPVSPTTIVVAPQAPLQPTPKTTPTPTNPTAAAGTSVATATASSSGAVAAIAVAAVVVVGGVVAAFVFLRGGK